MNYVYGLYDPITNELCYIGITNNLDRRKKQHLELSCFAKHYYSFIWQDRIRKLDNVVIRTISQFPKRKDALKFEKDLINYLAEIRYPLVNSVHYLKHNRHSDKTLRATFESTDWFIDEKESLI